MAKTKKLTPAQIRAEVARLSKEDQQLAQSIARSVWEYIGSACLQATIEQSSGRQRSMKRSEVVEVVLDADRYNEQLKQELRRTAATALRDNVNRQDRIDAIGRLITFFDYKVGASYEAQNAVIKPAFAEREG